MKAKTVAIVLLAMAMAGMLTTECNAGTCSVDGSHGIVGQVGDIDGAAANDYFGQSVSLSADGLTMAAGANQNDGNGDDSGLVRVYVRETFTSAWKQLGVDIGGEAAGDEFGTSVSLSADGRTLAIGAIYNDGNGVSSGHTRVCKFVQPSWGSASDSRWIWLGQNIDGEAAGDFSGLSVSLSADGRTVAIGAARNEGSGGSSGHASVWKFSGSWWHQLGQDIDGEAASDFSGGSVSLSADGLTVAIGAEINGGNGDFSGHTRVWKFSCKHSLLCGECLSSSTWKQLGQDIDGEAAGDYSGGSVSLSADGLRVAIGAYGNDENGMFSGHTRVWKFSDSDSKWERLGQDIDGAAAFDLFGMQVSLSADGRTVAIAKGGNGSGFGHASVWRFSDAGSKWEQLGQDTDGEAASASAFTSVSLSADGLTVAMGAPAKSGGNGVKSGNVRVFMLCTPAPSDCAKQGDQQSCITANGCVWIGGQCGWFVTSKPGCAGTPGNPGDAVDLFPTCSAMDCGTCGRKACKGTSGCKWDTPSGSRCTAVAP